MNKLKFLFNNKIDRLRTVSIILLIIVAIVQTTNLWYTNLANGGNFLNSRINSITDFSAKNDFLKPYRMLTTVNGSNFNGIYSNSLGANTHFLGEEIIRKTLLNGEFIGTFDISDDIYKKEYSLIFEYKYFIEGKQLEEILKLTNNNWNKINTFDSIILSQDLGSGIQVNFINGIDKTYVSYRLDNKSELASLKNQIIAISSEIQYTINFSENGPIAKYTTVPNWKNEVYNYSEITANNPYTNDFGEVTIKNVEENINFFFENPLNKKFSRKDNYLNFSDANTNVKYYDINNYNIGLIEYSYYNYGTKNKNNSVIEDFTVAKAMIEKDINQTNEYYLSDYKFDENEKVFKFDYVINNLPIYFSTDYDELLGTSSAIEITVRNGIVTKYKKIASNYSLGPSTKQAVTGVENVINTYFGENDKNEIKNITLAYKLDVEKNHALHWFVEAYENNNLFSWTTEGE